MRNIDIHVTYWKKFLQICSPFDLVSELFDNEGKGPNKEKYEEKIRQLKLNRVAFRTMWLSAEDYPLLLGRLFILYLLYPPFLLEVIYGPFIFYICRIS